MQKVREPWNGKIQRILSTSHFPKKLSNYHIIIRGLDKKVLSPQCFDSFLLNVHRSICIYIYLAHLYKPFHQKLSQKIIFIAVCICHLFHQIYHPFCTKKCTWHTHQNRQCVRKYIYCWEIAPGKLGPFKI